MKKEYVKPLFEITAIEVGDIIATSTTGSKPGVGVGAGSGSFSAQVANPEVPVFE